ncbi:MAG: hypothetical protein JWL84_4267 [Rhodospirillales bacterium]|nr:hypothetical protein [Rhodospirillales bacterium]
MRLRRKGAMLHWRRRVPLDLASRWGRVELVKALSTADKGLAEEVARRLSVISDRLFMHVSASPMLTSDQINTLARDWLDRALEADEEQRLNAPGHRGVYVAPQHPDQDPVDADQALLSDHLEEVLEALASNDLTLVRGATVGMLIELGIEPDPQSDTYRQVGRRLLRAHAELFRMSIRRREGDYSVQPRDPLFSWSPSLVAQPEPAKASLVLSAVVTAYVIAKERDGKWQDVTKRNSVNKLNLFAATLDDKPIDTVTREDIRGWRDVLTDSVELAPNTIGQHFKIVAGLFKWAKLEGMGTIDNPTVGLAPRGVQGTRDAFQPADLKKLFDAPLFKGHWRADRRERPGTCLVKDSKYWLPLIALHTGMRVEEIAKLKTADVREIEGIWCFDVYATKTAAGKRHVPVHPRLAALGFLDYVKGQKAERLWPDLTQGSEGGIQPVLLPVVVRVPPPHRDRPGGPCVPLVPAHVRWRAPARRGTGGDGRVDHGPHSPADHVRPLRREANDSRRRARGPGPRGFRGRPIPSAAALARRSPRLKPPSLGDRLEDPAVGRFPPMREPVACCRR